MLVSEIVQRNAEFYPDRGALVIQGELITTWGELEEDEPSSDPGSSPVPSCERSQSMAPPTRSSCRRWWGGAKPPGGRGSRSGKVLKGELRREFWANRERAV